METLVASVAHQLSIELGPGAPLWTEVGLFRVAFRATFVRLPHEKGMHAVRMLYKCLRNLVRNDYAKRLSAQYTSSLPTLLREISSLLSASLSSCQLAAAYLLQRLRNGHQIQDILTMLAILARLRALLRNKLIFFDRAAKTEQKLLNKPRTTIGGCGEQVELLEEAVDTASCGTEDIGVVVERKPLPEIQNSELASSKEEESAVVTRPSTESTRHAAKKDTRSLDTDVIRVKRFYRKLKSKCPEEKVNRLKKICLLGLRAMRTGKTSARFVARKMKAVVSKANKEK